MRYFMHPMIKDKVLEYREYQDKIAKECTNKNLLIVLPTGTGKTVIALLATIYWMDKHPNGRLYLLAPTRPLVHQHMKLFKNIIKEGFSMVALTGEIRPTERKIYWKQKFIFSTPQLLYNDLVRGFVKITNDDILIFDESHRAVGNHPYVKIIQFLQSLDLSPRIIALTASPGDKDKTLDIINNLRLDDVELYTQDDPMVSKYFHGYKVESIFVNKDPLFSHIYQLIQELVDEKIRKINLLLENTGVEIDKKRLSYTYLKELRDNIVESFTDEKLLKKIKKEIYELIVLERIMTYLETYTYPTVKNYMDTIFGTSKTIRKKGLSLSHEVKLLESYYLIKKAIESNMYHPKVYELIDLLDRISFTKCIIFTSIKDNALELRDILRKKNIKAEILVGQGKTKGIAMKQSLQLKTLDEFNKGNIKVLVATHVGEEGLDISEVDLVIFYDNPISAIRRIQRMGRTGRKKEGKVVYLIMKGTREESKFYAGLYKYKRLIKEIKSVKNELRQRKLEGLEKYINHTSPMDIEQHDVTKVIVDTREKSKIINNLLNAKIPIQIESLDIGDYIIGRYIIERKTLEDFARSIYDGRLFNQLRNMASLKDMKYRPLLLIEGKYSDMVKLGNIRSFFGAIISTLFDLDIPIIYTSTEDETSIVLELLYKKIYNRGEKSQKIRLEKKPKDIIEIQKFVLSGIPGIDTKLASRLLDKFGSLRNIANASVSQLMSVRGIGPELALRIYKIFNYNNSLSKQF